MISKELLSEICQTNLMSLGKLEVVGSDICLYDCSMQPDIYMCWNIYELAHKCKEWAYIQGYVLFSKIRLNSSYASCYFDIMGIHDYEDDFHNDFRAETEPDAIFKACEWILDRNSINDYLHCYGN